MDIPDGRRRLSRFTEELVDGRSIAEPYAAALGSQAKRLASRRPTPQAPMAGAALVVRGSSLSVPRGYGAAGAVAGGSEYGSSLYPQFGPRRGAPGHWLGAAAERPDDSVQDAGDRALDELKRRTL